VERLGLRLARKCGRPHLRYRFRVLNSEDVNAFALPGGFVYVTRGLIELAGNESELAGVLATRSLTLPPATTPARSGAASSPRWASPSPDRRSVPA